MGHDSDSFNRWEAAQVLSRDLLVEAYHALQHNAAAPDTRAFAAALSRTLTDADADDAFKALMLEFPPEAEIAATIGKDINADLIRAARQSVRASVAAGLLSELDAVFARTADTGDYIRTRKARDGAHSAMPVSRSLRSPIPTGLFHSPAPNSLSHVT